MPACSRLSPAALNSRSPSFFSDPLFSRTARRPARAARKITRLPSVPVQIPCRRPCRLRAFAGMPLLLGLIAFTPLPRSDTPVSRPTSSIVPFEIRPVFQRFANCPRCPRSVKIHLTHEPGANRASYFYVQQYFDLSYLPFSRAPFRLLASDPLTLAVHTLRLSAYISFFDNNRSLLFPPFPFCHIPRRRCLSFRLSETPFPKKSLHFPAPCATMMPM